MNVSCVYYSQWTHSIIMKFVGKKKKKSEYSLDALRLEKKKKKNLRLWSRRIVWIILLCLGADMKSDIHISLKLG